MATIIPRTNLILRNDGSLRVFLTTDSSVSSHGRMRSRP